MIDDLTDEQWERLAPLIPYGRSGQRGRNTNNRRFINALIWLARSGGRWRDLPACYGSYGTVKGRYYLWIKKGILSKFLEKVSAEPDMKGLMLDTIIVRAHAQTARARRKKRAYDPCDLSFQGRLDQ